MASRVLLNLSQRWVCILVLLTAGSIAAVAQDCYYPNGDLSSNDSPCSSDGGACCPLNWECLSNGLCYLESENYYERHTCTDQDWNDPNCPNICTYNGTAAGNEAILLCDYSDEASWCCDANRVSFDCCKKSGATTFSAEFGSQIATILSEPSSKSSVSAKTTSSTSSKDDPSSTKASSSSTSETTASTSSRSSTSSAPPSSKSTAVLTAITSDSNGQVSTLISTTVIITAASAATSAPTATPQSAHRRQLPVILGVSIGVPLGLIAGAILFYIFRRHKKHEASTTPTAPNTDVFFPPDATNLPTTYEKAELDSHSTSVAEKQQQQQQRNAPNELEATSPSLNQSSHPPSSVSPLTSSQDARWSAVSSLFAPNPDHHNNNTGGAPTALGLQTVGQQHYGSGQHYLYRPTSAPEGGGASGPKYRPYRPPAGAEQQQVVELAGSDVPVREESGDAADVGGVQEGKKDDGKSDAKA